MGPKPEGDEACAADGGDKRERQGDTAELSEYPTARRDDAAQRGFPVATAYANAAPSTAPTTALNADKARLVAKELSMYCLLSALKFAKVKPPSLLVKAPTTTIPVGRSRNKAA